MDIWSLVGFAVILLIIANLGKIVKMMMYVAMAFGAFVLMWSGYEWLKTKSPEFNDVALFAEANISSYLQQLSATKDTANRATQTEQLLGAPSVLQKPKE